MKVALRLKFLAHDLESRRVFRFPTPPLRNDEWSDPLQSQPRSRPIWIVIGVKEEIGEPPGMNYSVFTNQLCPLRLPWRIEHPRSNVIYINLKPSCRRRSKLFTLRRPQGFIRCIIVHPPEHYCIAADLALLGLRQ